MIEVSNEVKPLETPKTEDLTELEENIEDENIDIVDENEDDDEVDELEEILKNSY